MASKGSSKYRNTRTAYNGRVFASKREATHAATLDMLRRAANVRQRVMSVEYQYRMPIFVNETKVCEYVADFYVTFADGHQEVQDAKGFPTDIYKLKKKLVKAAYGIDIIEV